MANKEAEWDWLEETRERKKNIFSTGLLPLARDLLNTPEYNIISYGQNIQNTARWEAFYSQSLKDAYVGDSVL